MKLSQYFYQFPQSNYNNNILRNNNLQEMKRGQKGKGRKVCIIAHKDKQFY